MPTIGLTDKDLNAFGQGLATHFASRATGMDDSSERLVLRRPSDHVLAGFLTPVSTGGSEEEDPDAQLASDLPRDTALEQTSLGMHWLIDRKALERGQQVKVAVRLSVYVRRLPSIEDQRQALWVIPREVARAAHNTGNEPRRQAPVVPVWTREDLEPINLDPIDIHFLLENRILRIPLASFLMARLQTRQSDDLYPGRRSIVMHEDDVATDRAFQAWRADTPLASWPLEWRPVVDIRLSSILTEPDLLRLSARVINRTEQVPRPSLDFVDPNLYGVQLHAEIPKRVHRPTIFRELPQSFRYDRRMVAVGINAHAKATERADQLLLETHAVPIHVTPRLEPRAIPGATPRFAVLASDPIPTLRKILDAMRAYDTHEWVDAVASQTEEREQKEAIEARERFQGEVERFERGVALLANPQYPIIQRAFALMNRAMEQANAGRFDQWRLFQLVFVVSQLPGLSGREFPELRRDDDNLVDILWFAAGGGKTEAFLGLILWQAFFDRLRGKKLGVTAFVRFPLRLLTFQQLQRLSAALAVAELLRQGEGLGGHRFSIGYFVGRATTPNRIDDDTHRRFVDQGPDPKIQRLYQCPFCGAPTKITYDADNRLVEHRCTRAEQGCPNGSARLPVYVVDNDLYRFIPTIVVSTVDKLAQLGQNQRFAQMFGRITAVCPQHGVTFLGANALCSAARPLDNRERPETCDGYPLDYGSFHDLPPALLIQDELHLLSEELGTFDAHYETGVIQLVRSLGGLPWKVVAATATIENYQEHAWHLYMAQARQFPGPGPRAYDSFYYYQSSERIGRIFIGVLGVGRKHTPAVSRTLALLYTELQYARDLADHDLGLARRRYGVGRMDKATFDDLIFLYELVLTYVLTRKGSDQVAEAIESRVIKDVLDAAPNHGDLLVDTFNGGVSEADMSAAVQRIRQSTSDGNPAGRLRGIVATNVIGHGVDVDRFNVMVFAGFPRLVAEYIQASARVGRTFPGISVFVATPQSERDRSIFDRFVKFHDYLDRLVDPSAITRWPEPAMRRTMSGLIAGYLMSVAAERLNKRLATVEHVKDAFDSQHPSVSMASIVEWLDEAYGVDHAPSPDRYRTQVELAAENRYSLVVNYPRVRGDRNPLNTHLEAMQSLRDTDDPAFIRVLQPQEVAALRRLIHG